jgi:hypothetical protein
MSVPAGTAMSSTLKLLEARRKRNIIGALCRNTSCANAIATALLDITCRKTVFEYPSKIDIAERFYTHAC